MSYNGLYDFYRSTEWEKFRACILAERVNEHGDLIDEHTGKPIVNKYDAICHHIKPLDEINVFDADVAFNPDNIAVVSHRSHNEIHARFGLYTRHVYYIYGAPCAGKEEFVINRALKDDIIIDLDRLYSALTIGRSERLLSYMMQVYNYLLDTVKTRSGKWVNAYVIKCNLDKRLASSIGAEVIHIDTPLDECLKRSAGLKDKFVLDYFNTPPLL